MQIKALLISLILATSTSASPSPVPSPTPPQYTSPETPRAGYYPSSSHRPVYTAQRSHDQDSPPSSTDDDEPYPATSSLGTAETTHGVEDTQNTGFVEPIDFKNLLQNVDTGNQGLELGASASNPLFASESKNSFSGFFGSDNKDPFADFGGGGLSAASSERSTKNPDNNGESTGFVDPNVNFRSLFDSSQTASSGFRPQDFLGSSQQGQGDASGTENSRGSQTRAFPSFTYSGRKDEVEQPNRFRSNYRQIETQDDDYSDNNRGGREDEGDYEDSPRGPPPSPRYENPTPRYSPNTEESSNRPQSAGRGPKAAESKNNPKCKKIEKTVDYKNEDYASFTEPEPEENYDPSSYRGRYKRQSRTRQGRQARGGGGNKRPMTCYVCEDEQGRYAERCSYDSKGSPNKNNEYFHSSSSSFSDNGNNGRRPSGKSDRHRRNPSLNRQRFESAPTTLASVAVPAPKSAEIENNGEKIQDSEPKVIEKRQSGPDRYASNFGNNNNDRRNGGGNNDRNEFDYDQGSEREGGEFGLPRGYIGNNGGRVEDDSPSYQPSSQGSRDGDNFGFGSGGRSGSGGGRSDSGSGGRSGNNNDRDFGFGGGDTAFNNNDFNFGPPSEFGTESSPSGSRAGDSGFKFDFSIPKEYDPDVQQGSKTGNANRPSLDGSASSSNNPNPEDKEFDIEYDDYVKRYFPDTFGPPSASPPSSDSSTRPSSNSFQPSAGPPVPSYRPNYRHRGPERDNSFNQNQYHHRPPPHSNSPRDRIPDKEHTQPSYNFAPPPNFYNNGPQGGFAGDDEGVQNSQNLNKLVENFSGRDRAGCQKVQKGDMSCYVCRDASGMNKEECMYASNDPKNQRMAYHEVTEYSSDPPVRILPVPPNHQQPGYSQAASKISSKFVASPTISAPSSSNNVKSEEKSVGIPEEKPEGKSDKESEEKSNSPKAKSVTRVESSMFVTRQIHHENKSPIDYDFDY